MLQQIIDRQTRRQEQIHRQPGALPPSSPFAGARCRAARGRWPRHPRHGAGRRHPHSRSATSTSRPSATAAGGSREMVHPGNQEYVAGDQIERPKGGGGKGSGKGEAGDSGEGEDDFRLSPDQRRVHADLLRRSGPAAHDADPARRDARVEEPPRRLRQRRHAEQSQRRALDAWCDRPAAGDRCRFARRIARTRRATRAAAHRAGERAARIANREELQLRIASAAATALPASRTSIRSTSNSAAACARRCRRPRR